MISPPESIPPSEEIVGRPVALERAVGPIANFARAIAAKPPPRAIAARRDAPTRRAAMATVTNPTTDIRRPAAANIDVGGACFV